MVKRVFFSMGIWPDTHSGGGKYVDLSLHSAYDIKKA